MSKTLVVLGTYHQVQFNGHPLNGKLGAVIALIQDHFHAQILLEEWGHEGQVSFASTLGSAQLIWENVGTPDEERFETYRSGLNCHPPTHDPTKPMVQEYGPMDAQEQRENYIVERIRVAMEPFGVGLLILGNAHLHSLLSKLRAIGFDVRGYSWMEQS